MGSAEAKAMSPIKASVSERAGPSNETDILGYETCLPRNGRDSGDAQMETREESQEQSQVGGIAPCQTKAKPLSRI